jgi:hypothetical protein
LKRKNDELLSDFAFKFNLRRYITETMITFASLQGLLCIFFLYVRYELKKVHKYHHTVKMLGTAIFLALCAHIGFVAHYMAGLAVLLATS